MISQKIGRRQQWQDPCPIIQTVHFWRTNSLRRGRLTRRACAQNSDIFPNSKISFLEEIVIHLLYKPTSVCFSKPSIITMHRSRQFTIQDTIKQTLAGPLDRRSIRNESENTELKGNDQPPRQIAVPNKGSMLELENETSGSERGNLLSNNQSARIVQPTSDKRTSQIRPRRIKSGVATSACKQCRRRKTKCSAQRPTCSYCSARSVR